MNGIAITLTGNLTKDVELRYTPSGRAVASFTIAVTPRTKRDDQWVDGETTFLDCQAWEPLAEHVAESLERGSRILVTGTLGTERWQSTDGEQHERQRLTVDEIGPSLRFATARPQKAHRSSRLTSAEPSVDADEYHRSVQAVREQLGGAEVHSGGTPS